MADTSIAVLDATTRTPVAVDVRTTGAGDARQVVVLGDGSAGNVATVDAGGRLRVVPEGASEVASGALTTVAAALAMDVTKVSNVIFHVKNTGSVTLAAGTFVWEASVDSTDGTDGTWFGFQAARVNANTIETSIALSGITAGTGYSAAWEASVNGFTWIRIRCTVAVTASAVATWTIRGGNFATEPIPAAQASATQAVSGSITATPVTPTALNISSAATTNATAVKTSAGTLYSLVVSNVGAAAAFVKLYNKASAPTVGTDVPVLTIPVPASGVVSLDFSVGHRFTTGIALAITNLAPDSDTTAVAAAQVKAILAYS